MAGHYDNVQFDACFQGLQHTIDKGHFHYALNRKAVMRPGTAKCAHLSRGTGFCQFYGPNGAKTNVRESYLQGRGHRLSECPENQVRRLPSALFSSSPPSSLASTSCPRVDLQPAHERVPRSCNALTELDVTRWRMSPGHYRRGYAGLNAAVRHTQTRSGGRATMDKPALAPHAKSYSTYGAGGRNFAKYAS